MEDHPHPPSRHQSVAFVDDGESHTPTTDTSNTFSEVQSQETLELYDSPHVIPETPIQVPSHHSEQQLQRGPNSPSPYILLGAEQAAVEHLPALTSSPLLHELDALVLRLLNIGIHLDVVLEKVNQTGASFSHHLKRVQDDTILSQPSTNGSIKQDPGLKEDAVSLTPDNPRGSLHESQHESKSALREVTASNELLHQSAIPLRPVPSDADDLVGQIPAQPARDKPGQPGPKKDKISDEIEFSNALEALRCQSVMVGRDTIQLVDLAKTTINLNRDTEKRTTTDEETWQLLYNIIANNLILGVKSLYDIVEAMSKQPASEAPHQSPNTDELACLSNSICSLMADDDKPALIKLYSRYDHLTAVQRYDRMTDLANENDTKTLLEKNGIDLAGKKISAAILEYICQHLHDRFNVKTTVKRISRKLADFRLVCALLNSFGPGVLVLLGRDPRKLVNYISRKNFRGKKCYKYTRLCDVVTSLKEADQRCHRGRLIALFAHLYAKVLRPALHLREHRNTNGWCIGCPDESFFERSEVGERIWVVISGIRATDPGSGDIPLERPERSLKRRRSCNGMRQTMQGVQLSDKKKKKTSGSESIEGEER